MSSARPLRFLALVGGLWLATRAAMLTPWWQDNAGAESVTVATAAAPSPTAPAPVRTFPLTGPLKLARQEAAVRLAWERPVVGRREKTGSPPVVSRQRTGSEGSEPPFERRNFDARPAADKSGAALLDSRSAVFPAGPPAPTSTAAGQGRWSVSAWALARHGASPTLAAGGTLGGSQIGARATYRLNGDQARPVAASFRLYAPLGAEGAEAAAGVEWKPVEAVPVRLLAERRQALDDEGRSAFALLAHGGVSDERIAGPVVLDAYAQVGVVGLRSRDLFADGAISLGMPAAGNVRLGAALWGAAQPGAARVDAGPQFVLRLPLGRAALRLSAEYRIRLAGDAAPGSGPALTLGTDF